MIQYAAGSSEYVMVTTSAKSSGVQVDPTGDLVDLALMESGTPTESDWVEAGWETDTSVSPSRYYARAQLDDFTVESDTFYSVWIRVADNPETVVRKVGPIHVY